MRLLLISFTPYPEVRVRKMRQSLIDAGHRVMLICRTLHEPCSDAIAAEASPLPFSHIWYKTIKTACHLFMPDAIILRDIPLFWLVHQVAKRLNIPVITDIADDYAACIKVWKKTEGLQEWLRKGWRRSVTIARMLEQTSLAHSSAVLCICDEAKQRLISIGASPEHTHVVHNTPWKPQTPPNHCDHDHPTVAYVGEVHAYRGFTELLAAMQKVSRWHLMVIGTGMHLRRFRCQAVKMDIDDRVHWFGWQPPDKAVQLLSMADVGIIPHLVNPMTQNTQPNKLYEFMSAGLPIASTPLSPVSRVLSTEKCGFTFAEWHELPAILGMLNHTKLATEMGVRGYEAVKDHYHWQRDADVMLKVVEGL